MSNDRRMDYEDQIESARDSVYEIPGSLTPTMRLADFFDLYMQRMRFILDAKEYIRKGLYNDPDAANAIIAQSLNDLTVYDNLIFLFWGREILTQFWQAGEAFRFDRASRDKLLP